HESVPVKDGVPEGWKRMKVGELLLKVPKRKKIPQSEYLESGDIPCIDQGFAFIGGYTNDQEALIDSPLPITVFGDHNARLKFVTFPFAVGADGTQLIYPNTPQVNIVYLFCALEQIDLSNYFYARHFKYLKEEFVLIPSWELMEVFSEFAEDIFKQIEDLRAANFKAADIRDLLLPKLMSGQLDVSGIALPHEVAA
ncbi:MAG: restriction endonuclease subunit S, partial [Burkholderiales bacterium]|nr:restriction endonuclease subunit S [Burkholderiales bacterium]